MINDAKKLLLLRILVGLAWADRRIDKRERELIKSVGRKLKLSDEDQERIDALLDAPQDAEDAALLLRDYLYGTLTRAERREALALMETLAAVDGEVDEAERAFIDQLSRARRLGSPLGLVKEALARSRTPGGDKGGAR